MKDFIKFILIALITGLFVFIFASISPKIIDIYKNKPEIRTDTVFQRDTLWFQKEYQDSMPKYVYQTIIQRDTIYRQVGDSVEKTPRILTLKKKLMLKRTPWGMIPLDIKHQ